MSEAYPISFPRSKTSFDGIVSYAVAPKPVVSADKEKPFYVSIFKVALVFGLLALALHAIHLGIGSEVVWSAALTSDAIAALTVVLAGGVAGVPSFIRWVRRAFGYDAHYALERTGADRNKTTTELPHMGGELKAVCYEFGKSEGLPMTLCEVLLKWADNTPDTPAEGINAQSIQDCYELTDFCTAEELPRLVQGHFKKGLGSQSVNIKSSCYNFYFTPTSARLEAVIEVEADDQRYAVFAVIAPKDNITVKIEATPISTETRLEPLHYFSKESVEQRRKKPKAVSPFLE